ncbi:MAG: hypothetical protein CMJ21_06780 [Phycisphaerae bacterium]|nr:hypothetical protein [Phycisphaerae bacterium]
MNTRIIMMDYAGGHVPNAGMRGGVYGRREIADLFSLFRDVGFDTVWFRTSFCGAVCYHSKVMKPFDGEYRLFVDEPLKCAMAEFDPLEVVLREADRCGLKVLAWITPLDNYYPGIEDPVLARNPRWLLRSRDGRHAMRGMPCFAYREYMDLRVDEVREVMEYGCDGVFHSWATHCVCTQAEGDPPDVPDSFGFNQPILDEYHRRHGEPAGEQDYEIELIAEIHSDFMDDFVESAAGAVHADGGEYVTTTTSGVLTTDDYSWYTYRPQGAKVFRLPAHWRKWVKKGWVDRMSAGAGGHWLAENEKVAPLSVPIIGTMHAAWGDDPNLPAEMQASFSDRVQRCLQGPFGAVALQESDSIEASAPELWAQLKALFRQCESTRCD